MTLSKVLAILVLLVVILVQFLLQRKSEIPTFFIDLDLEPSERWKEVAEKYRMGLHLAVKAFSMMYCRRFNISKDELVSVAEKLGNQLPQEYRDEVNGIAKYGNVDETMVLFAQFQYELSTMCTTIVCVDDENVVWMFRNMDYEMAKVLQQLVIHVDFQRNNHSVYKGVTIAGVVGITIGLHRDSYMISMNRRHTGGDISGNIKMADKQVEMVGNVWPAMILVRSLLDRSDLSFDDVVRELQTVLMMAPCYFIVAGRKRDEGIIITRGRKQLVAERSLDSANDQWFVLTTNRDFESDEWKKKEWRYHAAHEAMIKMTRSGISEANAWKVLKTTYWRKTLCSTVTSVDSYRLSSVLS